MTNYFRRLWNRHQRHAILQTVLSKDSKNLRIIHPPDPRLTTKSEKVKRIDEKTQMLMLNMLYTMYKNKGIGLSAVQVGILKRIVVIDTNCVKKDAEYYDLTQPLFMINPEILEFSKKTIIVDEGCVSVPGAAFKQIERFETLKLKYLDFVGNERTLDAKNPLLSTTIQHEMDHLDGICRKSIEKKADMHML